MWKQVRRSALEIKGLFSGAASRLRDLNRKTSRFFYFLAGRIAFVQKCQARAQRVASASRPSPRQPEKPSPALRPGSRKNHLPPFAPAAGKTISIRLFSPTRAMPPLFCREIA